MDITTIVNEPKRGCGFRQPGGKYLVAPRLFEPCHRLPIGLHVCPVCNGGIKPARGWTWIAPAELIGGNCERFADGGRSYPHCEVCVACAPSTSERAGLIWVGEGFYKTPADFMSEVHSLGLSRRITNIPRGFEAGKTVVYLVHPKAVVGQDDKGETVHSPGIFTAFRPTAVEYILKGDESPEELHKLERKGYKLIRLVRTDGPQAPLPLEESEYVARVLTELRLRATGRWDPRVPLAALQKLTRADQADEKSSGDPESPVGTRQARSGASGDDAWPGLYRRDY